jgi:hypothetical protein
LTDILAGLVPAIHVLKPNARRKDRHCEERGDEAIPLRRRLNRQEIASLRSQ